MTRLQDPKRDALVGTVVNLNKQTLRSEPRSVAGGAALMDHVTEAEGRVLDFMHIIRTLCTYLPIVYQ